MKHEYAPRSHDSLNRTRQKKRFIDYLIHLAAAEPAIDVSEQAAEIVEEIKAIRQPVRQLRQLEELAALSAHNPDELSLYPFMDDTAEYILSEIQDATPEQIQSLQGISSAWDAIKVWNVSRSPNTEKLCVQVLDNFRGEAQPRLVEAYVYARDNGKDFNQALDTVNELANTAA